MVTFEPKPFEREGIKPRLLEKEVTNPNHSKNINVISSINTQPESGNTSETQNMTKDNKTKIPTVAKDFYRIPTRNKHGEIEVLTLLKKMYAQLTKSQILLLKKSLCHIKSQS